jgi:hypothetical protein
MADQLQHKDLPPISRSGIVIQLHTLLHPPNRSGGRTEEPPEAVNRLLQAGLTHAYTAVHRVDNSIVHDPHRRDILAQLRTDLT